MDVAATVASLGGVARTRELRVRGCTPASVASAVHRGTIQRIRIGWFGTPTLPDYVVKAHRVGGRPACATVAQSQGLWMLGSPGLHVEVGPTDSRFRTPTDAARVLRMSGQNEVVAHWTTRSGGDRLGQSLDLALAHMIGCVPELEAICAIDSAVHLGLASLDALALRIGRSNRRVLHHCDGTAESGVETIFRVRARRAGFILRMQVAMPGGRVDFVIGERLLVEVDGSEHHSGHEEFIRDRERDALHKALGYIVVRFTYDQVIHRWHEVESVLTLIVGRGEHLWPPRIRRSARHAG